ncbi:hypothetical protein Tco_0219902 [Tanacetum coccineum]
MRYSEKEGFDPENHSIVQFTSVKKEVTVEDFFRGASKRWWVIYEILIVYSLTPNKDLMRYSEKEGFDPENHSIVQFTSVKKEVTVEDFFRGGVKTMVVHIRDSDSVCVGKF